MQRQLLQTHTPKPPPRGLTYLLPHFLFQYQHNSPQPPINSTPQPAAAAAAAATTQTSRNIDFLSSRCTLTSSPSLRTQKQQLKLASHPKLVTVITDLPENLDPALAPPAPHPNKTMPMQPQLLLLQAHAQAASSNLTPALHYQHKLLGASINSTAQAVPATGRSSQKPKAI